jgi:molybdate transport system permease protein
VNLWDPVRLSLQVAVLATLCVVAVGLPLAWHLARRRGPGSDLLASLVALPLVLPPTVVGFGLLYVLGRSSPLSRWSEALFGEPILFHWTAAVVASGVVALPLFVESCRSALESVPLRQENAARILGGSEWTVFRTVSLPLARRGLWGGVILTFCRALGEFGATLMVAGNIPGRTQTLPLAIYSAVNAGDTRAAQWLVAIVALIGFAGTAAVYFWARREVHRER